MPGFDRTGPSGMGSMTGGGRGLCTNGSGAYGLGRRAGAGRGRGQGRGLGVRGRGMNAGGFSYERFGGSENIDDLRATAESMKASLNDLNGRISEMEKDFGSSPE